MKAQRQPGLARGHRDDEERENLSVQIAVMPGESDEVQSHALQHQFRAEEHHDQVPAGEEADQPKREQSRPDGEIVRDGNHAFFSERPPAMAMAPMVATSNSVPPNSTAIK